MRPTFRLSTQIVAAAVSLFAIVGGVAYASIPDAGTGTYHACLKDNGTIRVIDPAEHTCNPANESEITFAQKGATGTAGVNGVSPSVQQLAAGDAHCSAGGAAITDAAGSTAYVCSGQTFSGTFTSPNGQYSINVLDTGVTIEGPGATLVEVTGTDITVQSAGDLTVRGDMDVKVLAGASGLLQSSGPLTIKGSTVDIN
jgi:hypothetical protein